MKLKVKSIKVRNKSTQHCSVHILVQQQSVTIFSPFGVQFSADVSSYSNHSVTVNQGLKACSHDPIAPGQLTDPGVNFASVHGLTL